jgi:hypothetical protein
MKQLEGRLARLEERIRVKPGERLIYFMPNLEEDEPAESPGLVKLSPEVWAHVFGPWLSRVEIEKLREEFRSSHDCKT